MWAEHLQLPVCDNFLCWNILTNDTPEWTWRVLEVQFTRVQSTQLIYWHSLLVPKSRDHSTGFHPNHRLPWWRQWSDFQLWTFIFERCPWSAIPNASSTWLRHRSRLCPSVKRIQETWANTRMRELHYIYRSIDASPVRQYTSLQNCRREVSSSWSDSKARAFKKCRMTGNLQIWCAIKQKQTNKRHRLDIKHRIRSKRKWSLIIVDFLQRIDDTAHSYQRTEPFGWEQYQLVVNPNV